jgi:hypothetical protein
MKCLYYVENGIHGQNGAERRQTLMHALENDEQHPSKKHEHVGLVHSKLMGHTCLPRSGVEA